MEGIQTTTMNKNTILQHTASYEDDLISALKDPEEARAYLMASFQMYEEDGDIDALLITLRDIINAQGSINKLLQSEAINPEILYKALEHVATKYQTI